jgi:hypothetical protein
MRATCLHTFSDKTARGPHLHALLRAEVYIGKYPPPPRGKYQQISFGAKNMKRGREKGGKCKRIRKKGERK